jgi:hypothetical protein
VLISSSACRAFILFLDVLCPSYVNVILQIPDHLPCPESNRRKRSRKLLRGSERDLKLDISGVGHATHSMENGSEDRAESLPAVPPQRVIKVILFLGAMCGQ